MPASCNCPTDDSTAPPEEHDDECAIQEGAYADDPAPSAELVEAPAIEAPGLAPGLDIIPGQREMEGLAAMAATLAQAQAVPRALQNKPADVFLILLTARDLGISLTTAIRECHIIDGKVALSPKVKMAMIRTQKLGKIYPHQPPRTVWVGEEERRILCPCGSDEGPNNGEGATWHAERRDEPGILHSSSFTMAEAALVPAKEGDRRIKLSEKSTYKAWPARMLSWRALGHLEDDVFPEVGTGLYDVDQAGGMMDGDGQVIDVTAAEPLAGTGRHQRQLAAPEIPLASEEVRSGIQARVTAIRQHAEAKAELVTWWNDRGVGRVADLTEPQSRVVLARLHHVETKYELTPPAKPEEAADGAEAPAPSDPPAAPEGAQEPVEGAAPAPTVEGEDGIPASPPGGDVAGWLIQRASAMNSASIETAFKGQGKTKPTGGIADQRRAWAIDQLTRYARATSWLLSLGSADVAELDFIRE